MNCNLRFVAALAAALVITGSSAYAFQETEVPVTAPERGSDYHDDGTSLGLSGADEDSVTGSNKRSLYIPGLGNFKNLPDLDFGLELLYEDDEGALPMEQDGMGLKGRLKHNF